MLIANTQKQPLAQHLFAVGYLAKSLFSQIIDNSDNQKLQNAAYIGGCLHDLGKIDQQFQNWVNKSPQIEFEDGLHIETGKFSFEKYPRHNEISLLLYRLLRNPEHKAINQATLKSIEHVLYWHHAKPIRSQDYESLGCIYKSLNKVVKTDFHNLIENCQLLLSDINALASGYDAKCLSIPDFMEIFNPDLLENIEQEWLPSYKHYTEQNELSDYSNSAAKNAKNALLRALVITADRLISKLSSAALKQLIDTQGLDSFARQHLQLNGNLPAAIQTSLDTFTRLYPESLRNLKQAAAAQQLAAIKEIAVLQGAAGCGKTKIALEWALKTKAEKIIWVCPRVQVCQGLYHDLTAVEYLPNVKVEIHTGEFKEIKQQGKATDTTELTFFSGDVVITTIDQIINSILTHKHVTTLIDFMNAHVVFDEYHEYINMDGFNLLFAELLECKKLRAENAHTLLVSATPNYLFLKDFLAIDADQIVRMETFNNSRYRIVFTDFDETKKDANNPLYAPQPAQSFVISNTAITAQLSYIQNETHENALLLHSKFKRSDKNWIFSNVMESFGENGIQKHDILRSGPGVQASLNITCNNMVTEPSHAENLLQRLGRQDRFGKNVEINCYTIAIPKSISMGQNNIGSAKWLAQLNSLKSAKAWLQYLQKKLDSVDTFTLAEIYEWYELFYRDEKACASVREDLQAALKDSVNLLKTKLFDPVSVPNRSKAKDGMVRIKKNSLRGDNRFVQMAVCEVTNAQISSMAESYAYQETTEDQDFGSLTASIAEITGYGNSRNSALVFMAKKHHNIKPDTKKSYNDAALLNAAHSPEFPIYLSYTQSDLDRKQVAPENPDCAVYYVVGQHQAIGMMSYKNLPLKDKA